MQITIGRAKRGIGSLLPGQAYVGRPSVLGNPFVWAVMAAETR
jgi:hypothetical protein